ncbi:MULTISPECIES: two-partner secretion domain-containing protein [Nostocales]|uniref:Filamentous hemagglutinin N-terminal domain-containing protein n=3 Tax=Nostocales TaxID=1161 RepID=A0A8S9TCE2_9CYAN|nr:filamentous hemagglutinin N-terminal domain-containing protein [Tolypothrix bouteillei]KAF3889846.1 filamentous hemagglutinin N-terminal domain-containing protein [Tolypothrix bouteillei VB521301]
MPKVLKYAIAFTHTLTVCFVNIVSENCVSAQINPDETLGSERSSLAPNVGIRQGVRGDRIDGGAIRGSNLFHSFQEFNINEGQRVYFNNPAGITNIITRVTGTKLSNILGTLGVNGSANLFFINPNGMIFGQNARLDIQGSFIASTASGLNFADNTQFSATASQNSPLLTVSVPIGLQFTSNSQGILVRGNGRGLRRQENPIIDTNNALRTQPDRTLALVGGDVTFEGGTLKTAGGRIELGSVAGTGNVSLTAVQKGFSLGYEGVANFGDIQLSGATAIDASGEGGGEIEIRGKRVVLREGSQIEATRLEKGFGGKLTVTASDLVELGGTTADNLGDNRRFPSSLSVDNRKVGDIPGELTINTRQLIIRPGGRISASNAGQGKGGNITVNAADSVELIGIFNAMGGLRSSGISVQTTGSGDAGNLAINTKNLVIRDGAELSASTFSAGNGGSVEINASDSVELFNTNGQIRSRIVAEVGRDLREVNRQGESDSPTGQGGNLTIRTRNLTVRDGAVVTVSSRSENARAQGAGTLDVTARSVRLDNKGQITAATASGQGGNITLQVQDILLLRRNSLISTTAGSAQAGGDGGNININTNFIVAVSNENSDITANAFSGSGGNVKITAQSIFGLEPRSREQLQTLLGTSQAGDTDPSRLLSNDITAISQENPSLSGQITINTPDVDPSKMLVELPMDIVDVSGLIRQDLCVAADRGSKFTITGRGGLPPSPHETLNPDAGWEDWRIVQPQALSEKTESARNYQPNSKELQPINIIEAQGWVMSANGTVVLTAQPAVVTPQGTWLSPLDCQRLRANL